nr:amidohydrolase [Hyphomonas sp. Mor2]
MRISAISVFVSMALVGCGQPASETEQTPLAGKDAIIYVADTVITMSNDEIAGAVAVRDGRILAVGEPEQLESDFPGATVDTSFSQKVIVPGLIDPHIHMGLSSLQYATPLTPPWPMATPDGMVRGLPSREAFFERLREIEADAPAGDPLIVYGFHNLVHGDLVKEDLDAVTSDRPLVIWHYSSHDFYLNSAALDWVGVDPSWHDEFEGVDLDEAGELTGRIYEDAVGELLHTLGPILFAPDRLSRGVDGFSGLLRAGGVTTVADLGYGIFTLPVENANIGFNWKSIDHSGYRLYLVPEHRAFKAAFGEARVDTILGMAAGEIETPAPVLPQVKFFTDAAFYSQTMRVSDPGYLSGQSIGTQGLWVMQPDEIVPTIQPYWDAGLAVRIHSNGDAAQSATLDALAELRPSAPDRAFIFEHAGLFSPQQVARAAELGAGISAASHYVFYLGEAYQSPLGPGRGDWILPLASLSTAGVPVTLHSDAPLAPPLPLRAASVHMTRSTREGTELTPTEKLSAREALESITIDAAYALGLESELGSIAPGKLADFTILDANPLETPGEAWGEIGIWGVVLDGEKRPIKAE